MSVHLAIRLGLVTFGVLLTPAARTALGQDFSHGRRSESPYQPVTLYDRVVDSTRVSLLLGHTRKPFGLGSTVWAHATFTFQGRRAPSRPTSAVVILDSWTPARGGWAFAHPQSLQVRDGQGRLATIPASQYVKRKVHLFDTGRREVLSFRVAADTLATFSQQPALTLRAGRAVVPLTARGMEALRVLVGEMTSSPPTEPQ
jgi:hypothetical protein